MAKILWVKLGNAAQLVDELGSGITYVWSSALGIVYVIVQFDNGAQSIASAYWLETAGTPPGWDSNSHIADLWIKPLFSLVNGIPSDSTQHTVFTWFSSGQDRILYYVNTVGYNMAVKVGNVWYDFHTTTGMNWTAPNNVHLGHRYKRTGLDGGAVTREIWLGGSKINSTNIAPPNQANSGVLRLLSIGGAWPLRGSADDLVLYGDGDDKANFDDRIYEGRVVPLPLGANRFNRIKGIEAGIAL